MRAPPPHPLCFSFLAWNVGGFLFLPRNDAITVTLGAKFSAKKKRAAWSLLLGEGWPVSSTVSGWQLGGGCISPRLFLPCSGEQNERHVSDTSDQQITREQ